MDHRSYFDGVGVQASSVLIRPPQYRCALASDQPVCDFQSISNISPNYVILILLNSACKFLAPINMSQLLNHRSNFESCTSNLRACMVILLITLRSSFNSAYAMPMSNNQVEPADAASGIFGNSPSDPSASLHGECQRNSSNRYFDPSAFKNCGDDQAIDIESAQDIFNLRCSGCGCLLDYHSIINYIKNAIVTPRISFSIGATIQHEFVLRLIEKIISSQNSEDFFLFSLDCGFVEPSDFVTKLVSYCKHYTTEEDYGAKTKNGREFSTIKTLVATLEEMIKHRETVSDQGFKFNSFLQIAVKRAFIFYRINRSIFSDEASSSIELSYADLLLNDMHFLIDKHREPITRDFVYAKSILLINSIATVPSEDDLKTLYSKMSQAFLPAMNSVGEIIKKSSSFIYQHVLSDGNTPVQRLKILNFVLDDSNVDEKYISNVCLNYPPDGETLHLTQINALIDEISTILETGSAVMDIDLSVKKFNHILVLLTEVFTRENNRTALITSLANLISVASNSKYLAYFIGVLEEKLKVLTRKDTLISNIMSVDMDSLIDRGKVYNLIFHNSQPTIYPFPNTPAHLAITMNAYKIFDNIFKVIQNPTTRTVITFELFNTRVILPEFHEYFVQEISKKIIWLSHHKSEQEILGDAQHSNSPYSHYMLGMMQYVIELIESTSNIQNANPAVVQTIIQLLTNYRNCFVRFKPAISKINRNPFLDNKIYHMLYAMNYYLRMLVLDRKIPFDITLCDFPLDFPLPNINLRMKSLGKFMRHTSNIWVKGQAIKAIQGMMKYFIVSRDKINEKLQQFSSKGYDGQVYVIVVLTNAFTALLTAGIAPAEVGRIADCENQGYYPVLFSTYLLQIIFKRFPNKKILKIVDVLHDLGMGEMTHEERTASIANIKGELTTTISGIIDDFMTQGLKVLWEQCPTPQSVIEVFLEFVDKFKNVSFYVDFNRLIPDIRKRLTNDVLREVVRRYLEVSGRIPVGYVPNNYLCLETLGEIYPLKDDWAESLKKRQ